MWLLNTSTYSLEFVANPKDYAILSHTWEHEEVTFEDIKNLELAKTKAGWDKIEQTCRLAVDWNLQYAWVDTCCIDKSSSAELSEAINSMFQWYKQSTVCFVYLSDLESSPHDPISPEAEKHLGENLPGCRWFTRGWTLQELIAPYHVDFYDRNWTRIGTKTSAVMQTFLSKITKIDAGVLANPDVLPTMAVGRRMSWAAKRKTTRIEDIAYSLLGIFDVNMPMLYGEGTKAFIRLQEAIAEATGDLSLFAWSDHQSEHQHYQVFQGILARSPSQFSGCHRLENTENPFEAMSRSFTMVNRNIEFQTYLKTEAENGDYLMNLHCRDNDRPKEDTLVIRLLKTTAGYIRHLTRDGPLYAHADDAGLETEEWHFVRSSVLIPKQLRSADLIQILRRNHNSFRFEMLSSTPGWSFRYDVANTGTSPSLAIQFLPDQRPFYSDEATGSFLTGGYQRFTGMVNVVVTTDQGTQLPPVYLLFGFLDDPTGPSSSSSDNLNDNPHSVVRRTWICFFINPSWVRRDDETVASRRVFDVSKQMMDLRPGMGFPRFLSFLGKFHRRALQYGLSLTQRLFYRPDDEMDKTDICISASIRPEKMDNGDVIHWVGIQLSASEQDGGQV